jgi:peptidoglycan glycosyltransferase
VNRATQSLYAPGSTFKMITLGSAFENDVARENTKFKSPGSMEIGNGKVSNFDGHDYGTITLAEAMEVSSNTVFGQVGVKLGAEALVSTAEGFGFNQALDFDTELVTSLMPDPEEMTKWETAWAADGQPVGDHKSPAGPQASVLQMAMAGCAIANDGVIMKPYLVDSVYDADGERTAQTSPISYSRALDADVAKRVRKVMEGVIENGTATAAQMDGVKLAGKTGTAETGKDKDDSWFVCMGPSDDCDVVVAIVLEQAGEGEATFAAVPVIEAALQYQGEL